MKFLKWLITITGILLAQASASYAADGPPSAPATAAEGNAEKGAPADRSFPWYIILNSPRDIDALWQKIARPDVVLIKPEQFTAKGAFDRLETTREDVPRWLVESVHVQGPVDDDFAKLTIALVIVVKGTAPVWAPIRLDGLVLMGAREGNLDLPLRRGEKGRWQVRLAGQGEHRIQAELRAPVIVTGIRKSFSLNIPEAASTSVDLDFSHSESDIAIGADEVLGQHEPRDGVQAHLTAHLEPRSDLVVSWTSRAEPGAGGSPLLTAKGEIAIDIDEEQVRTRSSWAVRCVLGATRSLEMRLCPDDEITEFQVDDQPAEGRIDRVRGTDKLTIRLVDPLRVGGVNRLVMNTRRPVPHASARKISFTGFPLASAREQTGFIGITQSANLFVRASTSQGLRALDADKLPADLRARPSTSLAFEFLDQPFSLDLGVESSPPLVNANLKTLFRVGADVAQSQTTLELDCMRGRLSELELGVGAGLQLIAIGPPEAVDSWHLFDESVAAGSSGPITPARRLKIRLAASGRDSNKVVLYLTGLQRISSGGRVNLGLFAPRQTSSVSASYALVADRGLAIEPEDDSARIRRSSDLLVDTSGPKTGWPWTALRDEQNLAPLLLADDANAGFLPVRIVRHGRTIGQETLLSAQVSRRWVDVLERVSLTVRYGVVNALEIRVPAGIADRWELLDKELADREELGRGPDGARRYRLSFSRPVVDKATLRFRYRLPLLPELDAKSVREITIPEISFEDVSSAVTKVEMSLTPEIVLDATDGAWICTLDDARSDSSSGESAVKSFEQRDPNAGKVPFTFKVLALEPVSLPTLVVPRLLLKTVSGGDGLIGNSALYWVESHGADFPFALPQGARWIGARVDGRLADQVDYDPTRASYRLRFSGEVGSRPALVELEYQLSEQAAGSKWQTPRLLDGGVVLQALWEVRLPASKALLGVPSGWSDENQWYWTGLMWNRRPWKDTPAINEWILGVAAAAHTGDDIDSASLDVSNRYLFSRFGTPVGLQVWIVSRSSLVAICSGAALVVGFFIIFSRMRFRTAWLSIAVIGILAAVLAPPSVIFLFLESAAVGAGLTLLGLVVEALITRMRSLSRSVRGRALAPTRHGPDSSLTRSPDVGSDDSTAIRTRVPSTVDFVAAPAIADDPRGPNWENI